jgi:mercuric ion transport protein
MSAKIALPLVGGLFAGISASLCCVAPLLLLLLGFSGAWLGSFTALTPFRPVFIAIALATLIIVYWQLYKPALCDEGKACAKPLSLRLYKALFWCVMIIVVISIASPYLIQLIYG